MAGSAELHKIAFKAEIKKLKLLFWQKKFYPTQFKTFTYGIFLKNISPRIFPGGSIKNVEIKSLEGKSLTHSTYREISIPKLNSDETIALWLDKLNTPLEGAVWIKGDIEAADSIGVETYQIADESDEINKYKDENKWGDSFFIKSKSQAQQHRTNLLILLLTLLTVLQGVFGLDNIVRWLFSLASGIIINIGYFLIAIGLLLSKK